MMKITLAATALSLMLVAPPAFAADAAQMEANKKAAMEFYDAGAADGPEGLKAFLGFLREKFPQYHSDIKRAFADGDYVILHVHNIPTPGARGRAIMDIFKFENGKVVEHWDVAQDIPENPRNNNTMF
jgi:predicted SnoaL-like aldol condensation-catalyzing enzyme